MINEGLTIDGQTAIVQVQGTGPSAADRITEFSCQFNTGLVFLCKLETRIEEQHFGGLLILVVVKVDLQSSSIFPTNFFFFFFATYYFNPIFIAINFSTLVYG